MTCWLILPCWQKEYTNHTCQWGSLCLARKCVYSDYALVLFSKMGVPAFILEWTLSSLTYVSDVCLHLCVLLYVCVCVQVKHVFSSHQTSQALVPDSEVSHSLIILTFLYNDPMCNSPFSGIFPSLLPSIHLTSTSPFSFHLYFSLSFISWHQFCLFLTFLSIFEAHLFSLPPPHSHF